MMQVGRIQLSISNCVHSAASSMSIDGTFDRFIDPAPHTMLTASITSQSHNALVGLANSEHSKYRVFLKVSSQYIIL